MEERRKKDGGWVLVALGGQEEVHVGLKVSMAFANHSFEQGRHQFIAVTGLHRKMGDVFSLALLLYLCLKLVNLPLHFSVLDV